MRSIFQNAFRRHAAERKRGGATLFIGGRQMRSIFQNAFRRHAAERKRGGGKRRQTVYFRGACVRARPGRGAADR